MSCKIKVKKLNSAYLLKISGRMVSDDASKVALTIEKCFKKKLETIVVDLTEIEYIDSHGLGVFVFAWRNGLEVGKKLCFYNPQGFVEEMFNETKLISILEFVDNLENL